MSSKLLKYALTATMLLVPALAVQPKVQAPGFEVAPALLAGIGAVILWKKSK